MRLNVNGQPEEHQGIATVGDLLRRYDLPSIRVAVEVNRELVPRADFDRAPLQDDDTVEIGARTTVLEDCIV